MLPRTGLSQPWRSATAAELIDHVLVSHALVGRVEHVGTGPGEPSSITEDSRARRDKPASAHLPIVARFRLE
jgi:hypothetical protein